MPTLVLNDVERHAILNLIAMPGRPDLPKGKGLDRAGLRRLRLLQAALKEDEWLDQINAVRREVRVAGGDADLAVKGFLGALDRRAEGTAYDLSAADLDELSDILAAVEKEHLIPPAGARVWERIFAAIDAARSSAATAA